MSLQSSLHDNDKGFGLLALVLVLAVIGMLVGVFSIVRHKDGVGVQLKVSNGCKDTNIQVQSIAFQNITSPLTLQARLTMGTQPVPNERIIFRIVGTDDHRRALMDLLGYGTTDASGMAILQKPAGIGDVSIAFGKGGELTGYRAEFDGNNASDKVKDKSIPFYCGSNATANFSNPMTIQSVSL